ncbi:MAG: plasmid pRiA4b ORF-3 family protein [Firmicutes bacterium]|nr:plasmid pRiA4b ORF-3 family protein [Bacillota bacterium]
MKNEGTCYFCNNTYSMRGIKRHLDKCKKRFIDDKMEGENYYMISIHSLFKHYWMYLEVSENTTLKDIDKFLRKKWLECCDHLSMFDIDGDTYKYSSMENYPCESKKVTVKDVFYEGLKIRYEYDFGSTTRLEIKVLSIRKGSGDDEILVMARNNEIEFECIECGNKASYISSDINGFERKFFCDKCAKKNGIESLLPVVNSPRMGVCGYLGEG